MITGISLYCLWNLCNPFWESPPAAGRYVIKRAERTFSELSSVFLDMDWLWVYSVGNLTEKDAKGRKAGLSNST
jgi:hypothetical protein